MVVVFDASTIIALLIPRTTADDRARLHGLLAQLKKLRGKVVIPTPALAEFLVKSGHASSMAFLSSVAGSAVIRVEPFDERAAIEAANIIRDRIASNKLSK